MMPSNYRLQIIVLSLSLSCPLSVWPQVLTQQEEATTSSALGLLREELLDTVSLADAVYFISLEYGLIAEEVAEVYPELVGRNAEGKIKLRECIVTILMLLNELQGQDRVNQEEPQQIEALPLKAEH